MTGHDMSEKPVWLLDVDGVINALSARPPVSYWHRGSQWSHERINGYMILWSHDVVRFIREVHEEGLAEVRWHSTWQHLANEFLSPAMNLPQFEVMDARPIASCRYWWKIDGATEVLTSGRRILWTDDDLAYSHDEVVAEIALSPGNLVLSPRSEVGLLPRDLKRIATYLGIQWSPSTLDITQ